MVKNREKVSERVLTSNLKEQPRKVKNKEVRERYSG